MTSCPTFRDIEHHSEIIEDNEFFTQYTNEALPDRYDSNYALLKFSPVLSEFQVLEKMQWDYQTSIGQNHLQFKWPENTGIHAELFDYLACQNYSLGMQNLYWVTPELLNIKKLNKDLSIQKVTDKNFDDFLKINLEEDALYGKEIFEHKKTIYPFQYQLKNARFILAYLENQPAGSLVLFDSETFLEIDNVLTCPAFRNRKVAATMIHHAVHKLARQEQVVLLVADAEDTVKEMYEKMGFQYAGYQITAQKKTDSDIR